MITWMLILWVVWLVLLAISFVVEHKVERDFRGYSEVKLDGNMTGCEAAEKMLKGNGIYQVVVCEAKGILTDHYNPISRTLNLSHEVYFGRNIGSLAVAIHECGHAIQHDRGNVGLMVRSAVVPVVNVLNKLVPWLLIIGLLCSVVFPDVLLVGLILFGLTTLFSVMMLPLERSAGRLALNWLRGSGIASEERYACATKGVKSAANRYVVAIVASMANVLSWMWDGIIWIWDWIT